MSRAALTTPDSAAHRSPSRGRVSPQLRDHSFNATHGRFEVAQHEPRVEVQHRVPRPRERPIAACIRDRPACMISAIDLDDEAHLGGQEVRDEPTEQRHLPAERDTELSRTERLEELVSPPPTAS